MSDCLPGDSANAVVDKPWALRHATHEQIRRRLDALNGGDRPRLIPRRPRWRFLLVGVLLRRMDERQLVSELRRRQVRVDPPWWARQGEYKGPRRAVSPSARTGGPVSDDEHFDACPRCCGDGCITCGYEGGWPKGTTPPWVATEVER